VSIPGILPIDAWPICDGGHKRAGKRIAVPGGVPGTGQTVAVGQVGYLDKLAGDLPNPYRQTFAPVIEFSNADPARPSSR
jgi:hypothetical protein